MKELTIRATIPLPEDAFDAADVIAAARPAIEAKAALPAPAGVAAMPTNGEGVP
jgi:hypothetical protein